MRRLLAVVLPALVLLAAPALATAKEIVGGQVCGADGCRSIGSTDPSLMQGSPPVAGPSAREPFVRMDFRIGVPGHVEHARTLFLPRSGLILADDGATWMRPIAPEALRALAREVTAFPARALPASVPLAPAATHDSGGSTSSWWLAPPAAVIALAAAAAAAVVRRRRRSDGPARAAGARA